MKIKTILIDVDNTLLDFSKCAKQCIKNCFVEYGIEYSEEIFEYFVVLNDQMWRDIENNVITRQYLHENRWKKVFEHFKINTSVSSVEFENLFVSHLDNSHILVEGAFELLEYLSSKYDVYVASNSQYNRQFNRLTQANLMQFVKGLFTSGEFGILKPNKGFFDCCFEKIPNIQKDEVIMIGDSLSADISGGKQYGIKTCWLNFYKEPILDNTVADYIVNSLLDIKKIL